jgi:hypothetical protein
MCILAYNTYDQYVERQLLIKMQKQAELETPKSVALPPPPMPGEPNGSGAPVAKVEVAGIVKFEISEDNSWQTVFKILAIILGSVLGIKIINTGFNKLER